MTFNCISNFLFRWFWDSVMLRQDKKQYGYNLIYRDAPHGAQVHAI